MPPPPDHVPPATLRDYAQGRLAPDPAAAVEEHIGECPACARALLRQPNDAFVELAKQAAQASSPALDGPDH